MSNMANAKYDPQPCNRIEIYNTRCPCKCKINALCLQFVSIIQDFLIINLSIWNNSVRRTRHITAICCRDIQLGSSSRVTDLQIHLHRSRNLSATKIQPQCCKNINSSLIKLQRRCCHHHCRNCVILNSIKF